MKLDFEKYKNKFDYKTQIDEYRKEDSRIHQAFRNDALLAAGLLGHPKADAVYAKAWEHGHSAGFEEVFNWIIDLADLVIDPDDKFTDRQRGIV